MALQQGMADLTGIKLENLPQDPSLLGADSSVMSNMINNSPFGAAHSASAANWVSPYMFGNYPNTSFGGFPTYGAYNAPYDPNSYASFQNYMNPMNPMPRAELQKFP
ncbi:hypothetical protein M3Y99_00045500 [Aphelenchoides fujianensis]|nr:hypothetical protein M3Y99_00045500 [Aphelenchoides fujianensis]